MFSVKKSSIQLLSLNALLNSLSILLKYLRLSAQSHLSTACVNVGIKIRLPPFLAVLSHTINSCPCNTYNRLNLISCFYRSA